MRLILRRVSVLFSLLVLFLVGAGAQPLAYPLGSYCSQLLDLNDPSPLPEAAGITAYYDALSVIFPSGGGQSGTLQIQMHLIGEVRDEQTGQTIWNGPLSPTNLFFDYAWVALSQPDQYLLTLSQGTDAACQDVPWPLSYNFSCCPQCPQAMAWFTSSNIPVAWDGSTIVTAGWPLYLPGGVTLYSVSSAASLAQCIADTLPPVPTCPAGTTQVPTTAPPTTTPAPTTTAPAGQCSATTSPSELGAFIDIPYGACSANQYLTFTNTGNVVQSTFSYTLTQPPTGGTFSIASSSCPNSGLAPLSSCQIGVYFCSNTAGNYTTTGELVTGAFCNGVQANYPTTLYTSFYSTGTTAPPTTAPATTAPPPSTTPPPTTAAPSCTWNWPLQYLNFGNVAIGTCTLVATFFTGGTGTNAGMWSGFIINVIFNSPLGQFSVEPGSASTCEGGVVAPGAQCDVTVAYCPTQSGLATAQLQILASCGGNQYYITGNPPHQQTLEGTGVVGLDNSAEILLSMELRRRARLPQQPLPSCITPTSTTGSTTVAATTSAASTTSVASTSSVASTTGAASTSLASTTNAASTTASTTAAAAATTAASMTSTTSTAAAATTSAASTSTASTTAASTVTLGGISTLTTAATASVSTFTTSTATSTGGPVPTAAALVNDSNAVPTPLPLVACTTFWVFPSQLQTRQWYQQHARWETVDFNDPFATQFEWIVASVNLANTLWDSSTQQCTNDYFTAQDVVLLDTDFSQLAPYPIEYGGAFYSPGTNGFAQFLIGNAADSLDNNCPYSSLLANFDYGLADYCVMDIAFDPLECASINGLAASGTCYSEVCQRITAHGEGTRWDCATMTGIYVNYPGQLEGPVPRQVQESYSRREPWALQWMREFEARIDEKDLRAEAAAHNGTRPRGPMVSSVKIGS